MNVAGATCLVTGASRGIGREVARALHQRGGRVGLVARGRAELDLLAGSLGGDAAVAVADVSDPDALSAAVEEIVAAFGPVDVLVNNAGIGAYAPFVDADPASFEHLMRINYLATVEATRLVVGPMIERGSGHIVNVASVAGRLGAPFESAYSGSKFAVVGFSEAVAAELGPVGVQVSLVNPGPVATSFTEARGVPFQRRFPRPLNPERVARDVVRAIEHDVFEQTVPRWLSVGTITRAISPSLYRRGLVRSTAKEGRRRGPSTGNR